MSRPTFLPSARLASRRVRRGWHALRRPRLARPLAVVLLLGACDPRAALLDDATSRAGAVGSGAPSAEFLLTGVDSSFWILTGPDAGPTGFSIRRAPLALSRVDGRWQELYVAEEDNSFPDAIFVVQALWRRDLVSQDSALVIGDSLVPALAAQYARFNPDQVPLAPDELENEDPSIMAVAELTLLDVQGRFASVERYSDLHLPRRRERHELRRAVVDIASGTEVRLAALVGEKTAADLARRGRSALVVARDSARRVVGKSDAAAAAALDRFSFDERSFALTQLSGLSAVVFYAVGQGDAADGFALPLEPMAMTGGAWWDSARVELPISDESAAGRAVDVGAASLRWTRGELTVMASPDREPAPQRGRSQRPPASDFGLDDEIPPQRLTLRDSTGREWPVGSVSSSARRLYWLDRGGVNAQERRAIARAFYESAFQDGTLRAASVPRGRLRSSYPGRATATLLRSKLPPVTAHTLTADLVLTTASAAPSRTSMSGVRRPVRPPTGRSIPPASSR